MLQVTLKISCVRHPFSCSWTATRSVEINVDLCETHNVPPTRQRGRIFCLHAVAREYSLASFAQLGHVLLQTLLNRCVIS